MESEATNKDWRLTPREELFRPPARDGGKDFPPSVNVSDRVMQLLSDGRSLHEETKVAFCHILAESVIGQEPEPLAGYEHLYSALYADYAYYDADRHLEGFSEGMAYGMLSLAKTVVELLGARGPSFLPASVLLHPDVLLASCESHTMDFDKLIKRLGMERRDILRAVSDLMAERIVTSTIMGRSRFFFPSRQGEAFAGKVRGMVVESLGATGGDIDAATDRMMGLADFTERDAVMRAVQVVAS